MKNKNDFPNIENWINVKPTSKRTKAIWVKDKKALKFYKQMKENAKRYTKVLTPRIGYTSELDIFSISWGNKPVEQTIETNLLDEGDLRFDVTKNGDIIGIEIDDFSKVLRRFDYDKEPFKSEIKKRIKKNKGRIKK